MSVKGCPLLSIYFYEIKIFSKKFEKSLDKWKEVWYNIIVIGSKGMAESLKPVSHRQLSVSLVACAADSH